MKNIAWVLPAVITALVIEAGYAWEFWIPIPFLLLGIAVAIAGSMGGTYAGFLAGMITVAVLVHAHVAVLGSQLLSTDLRQVVLASVFFMLIGVWLGRLRDQRDSSIKALREIERCLETSLQKELSENEKKAIKVAESEKRLNTAVRIAGLGHFTFDVATGNCTYCSDQHAAHFGLTPDEFRARTAGFTPNLFYIHRDDQPLVLEAIQRLATGQPQIFEFRGVRPDGEIRYIRVIEEPNLDENGKHIENVGTSIDLTDLRLAEMRLRQSQRIEAIGTLTGGVAHDFNNLLAIILGNLELSLEDSRKDDMRGLVQAAIKATLRGADLTRSLLSFSQQAHLEPKRLNLSERIQHTMDWAARVLPETITIENISAEGLWDVELDATSLENALINLLLNARDAMPDGGKITIETSNIRVGDDPGSVAMEGVAAGQYVVLAVSDTGHGIPEGKFDVIFEPFYTEKPAGQGSGLGLSMVQGFIAQSGGAIRVTSEIGVGTTFKLYFKAVDQGAVAIKADDAVPVHPAMARNRILYVEDEAEVMRIVKRILESAGYLVTTARNGDEALQVFKDNRPFDLVLTDVVMPGNLQGPALITALRRIDADLPCVCLTGYTRQETEQDHEFAPSDIHLMKPVRRADLLNALSKVLVGTGEPD